MGSNSVHRDNITYNSIIEALCLANEPTTAFEYFKKAQCVFPRSEMFTSQGGGLSSLSLIRESFGRNNMMKESLEIQRIIEKEIKESPKQKLKVRPTAYFQKDGGGEKKK
eukprot:UN23193